MAKNCLPLGDLDRERIADIDRKLGLKLDGSQLAANTANRIRIIARASVQSAIDAGAVAADVWPQRSKTRARRKVARTRRSVDVRALPSPAAMAEAIEAIVTQQPGSKTYRVMTAVAYYAGLRPSEVVMLRVRSAELPAEGWGRLDVTEADISFDEPGEPKTGPRRVPIPPVLVAMLREWVEQNDLTSPDRLLFRTRNNTRPRSMVAIMS
jgi:integrase